MKHSIRKSATLIVMSVLLILGLVGKARADFVLDFEGLGDFENVFQYYNGGFGGSGSGRGPHYGVNFGISTASRAFAIKDSDAGGTGSFENEPSPNNVLGFSSASLFAFINVTGGFKRSVSFWYASPNFGATVSIYSQLDGTGTPLVTRTLAQTPVGPDADNRFLFPSQPTEILFDGIARSIRFASNSVNTFQVVTDNINFITVPEPKTMVLVLLGLLLMVIIKPPFGQLPLRAGRPAALRLVI